MSIANGAAPAKLVRCAIYTRKSTEEGLEKEFNSLDAQRTTAEAYIASQQHEGWTCLPQRYDDGGFTGGNLDRPALQQLLADIAAGQVDCVISYKVDRLSRSLLDFARIMELFDQHQVAFVSVTQQFSTATSVGRLILNVLLSFAQFERELIAERTRDKIAATRRQGKWSGGLPFLGYDVDPRTTKLRVDEAEAARVRAIFALFLDHRALRPVVRELERRGWRTKRWRTRQGKERGGRRFTRNHLRQLLTNVLYTGQVRYRNEVHPGEHSALIEQQTWEQVQALLNRNRQATGVRLGAAGLLEDLLHCLQCNSVMKPRTLSQGSKRARAYGCSCPALPGEPMGRPRVLAAAPVERLVVRQLQKLAPAAEKFRTAWASRTPNEQIRLVRRLVERIDYDASRGQVAMIFQAAASQILAQELSRRPEDPHP
jgi:site-specific DNA recombinase